METACVVDLVDEPRKVAFFGAAAERLLPKLLCEPIPYPPIPNMPPPPEPGLPIRLLRGMAQ